MITILQYVITAILIAGLFAVLFCFIDIVKCNKSLFYNRHGRKLLKKLGVKNDIADAKSIAQIQIRYNNIYTLKDIKWFLQDVTESEFLDNLPKEPEKQFVDLDFSDNEMYKVLYTASKMFGDDCLKYGVNNNSLACNGIGISFEYAIHAYASMLKKQNGYYKKYRLLI